MKIVLWCVGCIVGLIMIYALIPGFVSRAFGFRAFRRGLAAREVALTFDDGPDPVYTPRLLDLLKREGAKATFFVVGAHAEQNPELIRRMHEEGHTLGIHNYVHRSNWVMSPWTVKRHVQRTSDIIEGITGEKPRYYRPPWGIVNVFDFVLLRRMQIVLWTKMYGDWNRKVGAEGLYRKIRETLAPGQVLLLHDRGDTFGADREAPANTLAAVERTLRDGRELQLRFVGIGELIALTESNRTARAERKRAVRSGDAAAKTGPVKRVVVSGWMVWEKLFHVMFRLHPVGDGSFMHYRIIKYGGEELTLRDGSPIRRGDYVAEVHFDNESMYRMGMQSKSALQVALPDASRRLISVPQGKEIKALYGVSMVNRGAEGLGFDTFPLKPGLFSVMSNWYLKLLMSIIHPDGKKKIARHGEKMEPRMILMSREMLALWRDPAAAEAALKEAAEAKKPAPAAAALQGGMAGSPSLAGGSAADLPPNA